MNGIDKQAVFYGVLGIILGSAISFTVVSYRLEAMQAQADEPSSVVSVLQQEHEQYEETDIDTLIDYHQERLDQLQKMKDQQQ